ncbi:MAG: SDR family oxidoreductase [Candidatus Thiodiazotropha sp.]
MTAKAMKNRDRSTVLITGGSKGIGLELAKQFALHDHDLVLVARSGAELEQAAEQLQAEHGCRVDTFTIDLTASDASGELYRQVIAKGIQVDVLVNNAGMGDVGPFAESDLGRQLDMLQLNINTLTALSRLFVTGMIERGDGRILNLASLVAYFAGGPNWAGYVASKHYVLAFTRGLARELAGTGVYVTALCPGPTATAFVGQAGAGAMPIYRWLPKLTPSKVAQIGYRAVRAGRTTVVPGLLNKLLAFLGELPPRSIAQGVFGYLSRIPIVTTTDGRKAL